DEPGDQTDDEERDETHVDLPRNALRPRACTPRAAVRHTRGSTRRQRSDAAADRALFVTDVRGGGQRPDGRGNMWLQGRCGPAGRGTPKPTRTAVSGSGGLRSIH